MRLHAEEKMPALSWLTLIHAMLGVTALGSVQTPVRARFLSPLTGANARQSYHGVIHCH